MAPQMLDPHCHTVGFTGLAGLGLHLSIRGACGASWVSTVGEPLRCGDKRHMPALAKVKGNRGASDTSACRLSKYNGR